MTNQAYRKGQRFEWQVKKALQSEAWFVARHAKSALPDLVAAKNGSLLLIECKLNGISRGEKARLRKYAEEAGGIPLLATATKSKIGLFLITQDLGLRPFDLAEFSKPKVNTSDNGFSDRQPKLL
jgi:Holliday junction resolvase